MKIKTILSWTLRIAASVILLQTLYFKFTAHPESVELFTKLGVEPWGRIGTGIIELITGVLLLIPVTAFIGAFLGLGLMAGAILSHLAVIGIESKGDGGQLFILAVVVLFFCLIILLLHKQQGLDLIKKFRKTTRMKPKMMVTLVCLFLLFMGCKKKNLAPTESLTETIDSSSLLLHSGNFSSGSDKTVSGKAEIYKMGERYQVYLSNFSSSNGPALHVFLSKEAKPNKAIDLGSLKSTKGNQVYDISGMPDFNAYKYISIHCVQYNHYFGSANIN
jgi:putative oxidoreductase